MQTLFNSLRRLGQTINLAFCRLTEIQFEAPWAPQRSRCN
jgi:hypothetical protein